MCVRLVTPGTSGYMPNGIGQAYHWFNFLVGLRYYATTYHCRESGRMF